MGKRGGKARRAYWAAAISAALLLLAGCSSSDFQIGTTVPWFDLSGRYVSSTEIGPLGVITLELGRFEDTEIFTADLSSSASEDLKPVHGAGTLGDYHLILDFDIGVRSDYYFEGQVTMAGEQVESIDGQFVFPDQEETLPASFVPL